MNRKIFAISAIFFAAIGGGCSAPRDVAHAEIEAVERFASAFEEAVRAGDAHRVYGMISPMASWDWDEASFASYFESNRLAFEVYAAQLRDDVISGNVEVMAHRAWDACGNISLTPDASGWRMRSMDQTGTQSPAHLRQFLRMIESVEFRAALGQYASQHPEIDDALLRRLIRWIANGGVEAHQITFSGDRASVEIEKTSRIELACRTQGWTIVAIKQKPQKK